MKESRIPKYFIGITLFLLYLPILVLVINSFNSSRFGGQWLGFSLKWYKRLLSDSNVWDAVLHSLIVAVSATIVSTILGTMAAYALRRFQGKWQKLHWSLIYSPLVVPDILMGVALLIFFVVINLKLGLFTIFLAHTTFCLSYVTLVMINKLQHFDFSLLEAAQDLGAHGWQATRKVLLPLLAPGMAAAALLSFTLSIDDFVITFFVTGPGSQTLPIFIYGMVKYGSTAIINALSTIILVITITTVVTTQYLIGEERS